jgi:hypothetical protein
MSKQSDERQAAELAKLLREIVRDLGAGILATDLPAPFEKAHGLVTALDRGCKATSGVYAKDDRAVKYFKKHFGVNVTGDQWFGSSFNPMPPDPQSARVRAVHMLLWRFQERAMCGQKAEAADLAKLLMLTDSLCPVAKAPDGAGESKPPLSPNAALVLDILKALPTGRALTGPKILDALAERTPPVYLDQGTLTSQIMPLLKEHYGVKNKPRIGYHVAAP